MIKIILLIYSIKIMKIKIVPKMNQVKIVFQNNNNIIQIKKTQKS